MTFRMGNYYTARINYDDVDAFGDLLLTLQRPKTEGVNYSLIDTARSNIARYKANHDLEKEWDTFNIDLTTEELMKLNAIAEIHTYGGVNVSGHIESNQLRQYLNDLKKDFGSFKYDVDSFQLGSAIFYPVINDY